MQLCIERKMLLKTQNLFSLLSVQVDIELDIYAIASFHACFQVWKVRKDSTDWLCYMQQFWIITCQHVSLSIYFVYLGYKGPGIVHASSLQWDTLQYYNMIQPMDLLKQPLYSRGVQCCLTQLTCCLPFPVPFHTLWIFSHWQMLYLAITSDIHR